MPAKRNTPTVLIPLTRGMFAKIDATDVDRVCAFSWRAAWSGTAWYATASVDGQYTYMHRFIAGATKGSLWDHDNGDTLDNRRENIRPATPRESVGNTKKRKDNTSGYRGVAWHKRANKWVARINRDGLTCHIGLFESAENAARAYDKAATEWFGVEFARLNFSDDEKRVA